MGRKETLRDYEKRYGMAKNCHGAQKNFLGLSKTLWDEKKLYGTGKISTGWLKLLQEGQILCSAKKSRSGQGKKGAGTTLIP